MQRKIFFLKKKQIFLKKIDLKKKKSLIRKIRGSRSTTSACLRGSVPCCSVARELTVFPRPQKPSNAMNERAQTGG